MYVATVVDVVTALEKNYYFCDTMYIKHYNYGGNFEFHCYTVIICGEPESLDESCIME